MKNQLQATVHFLPGTTPEAAKQALKVLEECIVCTTELSDVETGEHEFAKELVLSTGHLTDKELDLLDSYPVTHVTGLDYGYLVWIPEVVCFDEQSYPYNLAPRLLPNLLNIILYANSLDCQWVRLDTDGPKVAKLKYFS